MPPDLEDFPIDYQHAIIAYGTFPDKIMPDIGFMGKDFSFLKFYIELYEDDIVDQRFFFEALQKIDALFIEDAREKRKAAR